MLPSGVGATTARSGGVCGPELRCEQRRYRGGSAPHSGIFYGVCGTDVRYGSTTTRGRADLNGTNYDGRTVQLLYAPICS
eukprot:2586617-Rhodomonas_salina.2